ARPRRRGGQRPAHLRSVGPRATRTQRATRRMPGGSLVPRGRWRRSARERELGAEVALLVRDLEDRLRAGAERLGRERLADPDEVVAAVLVAVHHDDVVAARGADERAAARHGEREGGRLGVLEDLVGLDDGAAADVLDLDVDVGPGAVLVTRERGVREDEVGERGGFHVGADEVTAGEEGRAGGEGEDLLHGG